jgi:hypothetical protein
MANVLHVAVSGAIAGERVVEKRLDGGRIVLAPTRVTLGVPATARSTGHPGRVRGAPR